MTPKELLAYQELEKVCNHFIAHNYPHLNIPEGYKQFLKDMENENEHWIFSDSIAIANVNHDLKEAFGNGYNSEDAHFTAISSLYMCLVKPRSRRNVNTLIENVTNAGGGLGTGIVGWNIILHKFDPTTGKVKVIFLTEVVYRILYFHYHQKQQH
ncbi:MAG: hypothetical protein HOP30_20340 [Cyclobacteriaceae bacterium]|nr:hypothetical protein [Cyclobacteriaceae bacterium]